MKNIRGTEVGDMIIAFLFACIVFGWFWFALAESLP